MPNLVVDLLQGKKTPRPPIWFMRQAGRVLPSYLALREKYELKELMDSPRMAAEVTLLPLNDLGVDAAILFSDILVIPEALGMKLSFSPKPQFENPLRKVSNVKNFFNPTPEKLSHIYQTIDLVRKKLHPEIALIGFCGSPFTVLCFMYEGMRTTNAFSTFLNDFYAYPKKMLYLLEQITELSIEYAVNQVKHGIDVFQLFDTYAGLISFDAYEKMVLPFVKKILHSVRQKNVPTIFFPKGIGVGLKNINSDLTDAVSIDWQTPIKEVRSLIGNEMVIQGNFNPRILLADKEILANEINKYIAFGKKETKWIFNLGHGFIPETPIENIHYLITKFKAAFSS